MATLAETRARVRRRLEDTTATPLWADALIDDGLTVGLAAYSEWEPEQAEATFAAAAGDTDATTPSGALAIVRISDPDGYVIPKAVLPASRYMLDQEQAWATFANVIEFARPLEAGTYTVRYTRARTFPAAAGDEFPVPDADLGLVVDEAALFCLEQRIVAEGKRGPLTPRYDGGRRALAGALRAAWDRKRRRVRVGGVAADG